MSPAGSSGRAATAAHVQTVASARRDLARTLRQQGLDTPELDARLLVGHALGCDLAALTRDPARALTPADADAIDALAARRLRHEPVARIVGAKEFWGLPFRLNADTLVPRPETEAVIEAALDVIDNAGRRTHALRVADLGTGSGAILLALLAELPAATGVGTDISAAALACARDNARLQGVADRAAFVLGDYGTALGGPFDLVVCNPPYVAQGDIASLQPEVTWFDPLRALDGGPDGLDGYRAVAADARRLLDRDGSLIFELGAGQHDAVAAIVAAHGLRIAGSRDDLAGIARALVVSPPP